MIVSNPPYIKTIDLKNLEDEVKIYEPKLALDGGNDGLDVIKKVIYKSKEILKFRALLALEIGNGQYKKVSDILKKNNFKIEHIIKDYKDNTRCLISSYIKNLWIIIEGEILELGLRRVLLEEGMAQWVPHLQIILTAMEISILIEMDQWIIFTVLKKLCKSFNS